MGWENDHEWTMGKDLEKIVVAYFKVLFWYLPSTLAKI
jgi:hypothetical protein